MKRPSFQWYPGDWLQDLGLRTCSVAARGLWVDMLCLMHQGSPYGYLKVNLQPILTPNLARITGATIGEVEGWIGELERAGVFSRDDDGAIYSRRMVRDENVRLARAAGGVLGGNPALKGGAKVGKKVNLPPNLQPTPSSSSSSSSSIEIPPPSPKGEGRFPDFWNEWPKSPRRQDRKKCLAKWQRQKWDGEADAILAHVVAMKETRQWLDGFEPAPLTYLNGERWKDGAVMDRPREDIFAGAR